MVTFINFMVYILFSFASWKILEIYYIYRNEMNFIYKMSNDVEYGLLEEISKNPFIFEYECNINNSNKKYCYPEMM